ncbi:hypothetical protein KIH39_11160 [Telmatocola sphagniphila]|uniref:Uncharacterized protein n=1 Tax=Telmatocola sphagniphila TaxID=1123043 RepID=A0A8E6EWX1_9BACT|nr:hypothetical protein [Telmatocola sphagniphila]QVL34435.1 hypothetical protein KIH39_11160 [Telmatocola sphagniphila]
MVLTVFGLLIASSNAMAYIGPGSGMEFIGYAMGLLVMLGAAFFSMLMWPVYTVLRWIRGPKLPTVAEQKTDDSILTPPTAPIENSTESEPAKTNSPVVG